MKKLIFTVMAVMAMATMAWAGSLRLDHPSGSTSWTYQGCDISAAGSIVCAVVEEPECTTPPPPPPSNPLMLSTSQTACSYGTQYVTSFTASGGAQPYTWTVTGALPQGVLWHNPTNNKLQFYGYPIDDNVRTQPDVFPVTVTVRDNVGGSYSYPYNITCRNSSPK